MKTFTVIWIEFLFVFKNKYYVQVYLYNCVKAVREGNDRLP